MAFIKKYSVWLALFFTLVATVWVSRQEYSDEVVAPVYKKNERAISGGDESLNADEIKRNFHDEQSIQVSSLKQRWPENEVPKDIFSIFSISQNESAVNTENLNTPVVNPFIYAGKIIEEGESVVFLIDGEKSHAVRAGDVIEDTWKVKSITPLVMKLKNIPLKVEVQMEIGANS